MKKTVIGLLIVLMAAFGATQAGAWSLELTPSGVIDVIGQTSFDVDVWFNPEGSARLDNYAFNLFYDTSELSWNSGNTSYSPPSGLSHELLGPISETTSGFIQNINAATFATGPTLTVNTNLATISFDLVNPGVVADAVDVWFDTAQGPAAFTVDGTATTMNNVSINGIGPDVVVTPEPVSSALFLVGGATLGFRRFKRRKK